MKLHSPRILKFCPPGVSVVIDITPAQQDPSSSAQHSCDLIIVVSDNRTLAVKFTLYTGWYKRGSTPPIPAALAFHYSKKWKDTLNVGHEECAYLNNRQCFVSDSTLAAQPYFQCLLDYGLEETALKLVRCFIEARAESKV